MKKPKSCNRCSKCTIDFKAFSDNQYRDHARRVCSLTNTEVPYVFENHRWKYLICKNCPL